MRAEKVRVRQIPSCGVVKGGLLNEWRFHFLHVTAGQDYLLIFARCTPPAWPFPKDIYMDHRHFGTLRPVSGDRAKRLNADELIKSAYALSKVEPPYFVNEPKHTLRALLVRVNTRRIVRSQRRG